MPGDSVIGDPNDRPGYAEIGVGPEPVLGLIAKPSLKDIDPNTVVFGGPDLHVLIGGHNFQNPTSLLFYPANSISSPTTIATTFIDKQTLSAVIPAALLTTGFHFWRVQDANGLSSYLVFVVTPSMVNHVMPVTPGSYTITGNVNLATTNFLLMLTPGGYVITGHIGLTAGYVLSVNPGSYTITGQLGLAGPMIIFMPGSYTLTGSTIGMSTSLIMPVSSGTYTITGVVGLNQAQNLLLASGSYTLTGNVGLMQSYIMAVSSGSYTLTGSAIGLTSVFNIAVASGSYALTGSTIGLSTALTMSVASGVYTINGVVGLVQNQNILIPSGTYTLTGSVIGLRQNYFMSVSSGSYTITGSTVNFATGTIMPVSSGVYTITGNIGFTQVATIFVASGSYALIGSTIGLKPNFALSVASGSYTITGSTIGLSSALTMSVSSGVYTITGAVGLVQSANVMVASGSYTLTGSTINLVPHYSISVASGSYTITGSTIGLTTAQSLVLQVSPGQYAVTFDNPVVTIGTNLPLPDYVVPVGNPGVLAGMDIFQPVASSAIMPVGPSLNMLTPNGAPAKALNIAGTSFDTSFAPLFFSQSTSSDTVFINDQGQRKLRLAGQLASWSYPNTAPPSAAMLVWPSTSAGIGKPKMMNKADPQWLCSKSTGFSSAVPLDTIQVVGKDLCKPILSSGSAVSVGTGTKSFNIGTGLRFSAGQVVMVLAASITGTVAGGANFMDGTVTSYNAGILTVNVTGATGSGSFTNWKIYTPTYTWVQLSVAGTSGFVNATYADPWCINFVLPSTVGTRALAVGDQVTVTVHNSMGGIFGYAACPQTINVQSLASLGMNYANGGTIAASGDTTGTTDTNNLIAAITTCTVPTRFTLQAANYYFKSLIFLGGHFGVAISLQGAGKGQTFLNAAAGSNFAGTDFFQCNNTIPGELNSLTVVCTGNTTFANVVQVSRLVNVSILAQGCQIPTVRWDLMNGYATGCDITGQVVFGDNPVSVYMDQCNRYVTDGDLGDASEIGVWIWGAHEFSITRCTCQDLTPNGPLSQRGGGKFVDMVLNCWHGYIARNTTTKLSPLSGDPIPTSGEQIDTEGSSANDFSALVQSTTTVGGVTTLTFASPDIITAPCHIFVIVGNGIGQWARVTSRSGNTFTLDRLLTGIDTTSQVNVILTASDIVAVMNTLNGNNQSGTASTGWENFDGGAGCIFQHNSVSACLWGATQFGINDSVVSVYEPIFWNIIADNDFTGCQYGLRCTGQNFIGNIYRDNHGATTVAEWELDGGPVYPMSDGNVSDGNTFVGAPTGIYSQNNTPPTQKILLWNTQFIGNGTGPAFSASASGYAADQQGSTSFSGFTTTG